ncbi:Predicted N-acetyltransferase YhbS [Sphingomonas guangdongensis]|uniref:Predicted N-acetyltransferase YhbS n=1 Tax=Sphingomonas guangdongensis TaxID=1141890 RepID=A0A285R2D2_9SPHN|nr:N-acetyltransferase [Sphingomonas guangdongensis]SOB87918.1 Predicted N-acetyltransferase YhbS [Sphingomonas guangdongensis]
MSTDATLLPLAQASAEDVESLLDAAFGPDRRARTAYRLRAGTRPINEASFAAIDNRGALIGSIQCWPVSFAGDDGGVTAMILVGPVAVHPSAQRAGLGRRLVAAALVAIGAADVAGADALMLIGDPDYYGRFFGFSAERTGAWRLPGPFEPHRLLARGTAVPAGPGMVQARLPALAR